ncbi:MAG: thioredoxin family protein [Anaerolineaceae bacterium]|nr:thioredoxin family protein [Anaerolineaceae bacterium]
MKIQIIGAGCEKCRLLAANADQAARELRLDFELVKVTDPAEIMALAVLLTPALAVDGEVKLAGRAASVEELKTLLA